MQGLIDEFSALRKRNFVLDFTYPDDTLLSKLRIVHRDLSPQEKNRLERRKSQLADLLVDLENGELHPEDLDDATRSEEHTSELQSLMRSSYAVFCLKKKNKK